MRFISFHLRSDVDDPDIDPEPEYFAVLVSRSDGAPDEEICDLTASLPEQWQPVNAKSFLKRGEDAFRRADEAVRERRNFRSLKDVVILAPVVQPKQVVTVINNYLRDPREAELLNAALGKPAEVPPSTAGSQEGSQGGASRPETNADPTQRAPIGTPLSPTADSSPRRRGRPGSSVTFHDVQDGAPDTEGGFVRGGGSMSPTRTSGSPTRVSTGGSGRRSSVHTSDTQGSKGSTGKKSDRETPSERRVRKAKEAAEAKLSATDNESSGIAAKWNRKTKGADVSSSDLANWEDTVDDDSEMTKVPIFFTKYVTSTYGQNALLPKVEGHTWHAGCELAVVIGRNCRRASEQDALDYVAGYAVAHDFAPYDWETNESRWLHGAAYDMPVMLGPWMTSCDSVEDAENLTLETRVNGEIVQVGCVNSMIFSPAQIIEHVSRFMSLFPGDVILTGRPPCLEGETEIEEGDEVTVKMSELGEFTCTVFQSLDD